jgi:hypothetical protein
MEYTAQYSNANDIWWIEDSNGQTICDFYMAIGNSYSGFDNAEENCKNIVRLLNIHQYNKLRLQRLKSRNSAIKRVS